MKSLIKPAGLVVLFGLLMFFGAQLLFTQETKPIRPTRPPRTQDTTKTTEPVQKETYVSKVMISAPWAEKNLVDDGEESPPGQFGIRVYSVPESLKEFGDVPPPEGPTSFTVAPNGDIYITDPLNGRIQRFDENGNFVSVIPIPPLERSKYGQESDSARIERLRRAGKLPKDGKVPPKPKSTNWYKSTATNLICVDRSNNVYLLRAEGYTNQSLYKYDQQGKLLATYPFFPEVRIGGGDKLYCDSSDRLFLQYSRRLTDKIILSLEEWDSLRGSSAPFTFQIGTADQVFTPEEQKATLRRGGGIGNTCALDKNQLFQTDSFWRTYYLVNFVGDTVRTFNLPDQKGFVGFDGDFNIYTHNYDFEKEINSVRKYSPEGILISTIQYYPNHFVSPGVDCQGNLYIFTWFEDKGVEVTKCYKQP